MIVACRLLSACFECGMCLCAGMCLYGLVRVYRKKSDVPSDSSGVCIISKKECGRGGAVCYVLQHLDCDELWCNDLVMHFLRRS